jgi:hypothetical protein
MQLRAVSFLYRRAILIYIGTIVVPVAIFVWLVFQSFEEQRQLLTERTQESIERLTEDLTEEAVEEAFDDRAHQIIEFSFTMKNGVVTDPQMVEPLPESTPAAFDVVRQWRLAQRVSCLRRVEGRPRAGTAAARRVGISLARRSDLSIVSSGRFQ